MRNLGSNTRINTIFFDVGRTLLRPSLSEGLVFSEEAARFGVALDPEMVSQNIPRMYEFYEQMYQQDESFWADEGRALAVWTKMYEFLCSLAGVEVVHHAAIAQNVHRRYFSAESWEAYDDVVPVLEKLQYRGYRMGVISNWDSTLEGIIEGLSLAPFFELVISSTVAQLHKPMPEIFCLALERMGVSSSQAMHVGDHPSADVEGARAAGMTPVLIDRRGATHSDLEQNTIVISSLFELLDYL